MFMVIVDHLEGIRISKQIENIYLYKIFSLTFHISYKYMGQ